MSDLTIEAYIDGSCWPNPNGVGRIGVFAPKQDNWKKALLYSGYIGKGWGLSNNVVEYAAAIAALQLLSKYKNIKIHSDSKMLVLQMSGSRGYSDGMYIPFMNMLKQKVKSFELIKFIWIPRKVNVIADSLSKNTSTDYCEDEILKDLRQVWKNGLNCSVDC